MEENQEVQREANQEIVDSYRDLIATQGWSKFLDLLDKHLKRREVVKAEAIRINNFNNVSLHQGFIDALTFVISEPTRIITRLTDQSGDE